MTCLAAGLGMRMPTVPRSAVPRVPIMVPPARRVSFATWDFFLTGVSAKRLYQVVAQGTFNKSGQADGGAPVMSTPILAPI